MVLRADALFFWPIGRGGGKYILDVYYNYTLELANYPQLCEIVFKRINFK